MNRSRHGNFGKKAFFLNWRWPHYCCFFAFSTILWVFLAIWVIFPIIVMNSIKVQRCLLFWNWQNPCYPQFDNPELYNVKAAVNFYLNTTDRDRSSEIRIGAWLVVPEGEIKTTVIKSNGERTAENIIKNTKYPVILYLHGVGCNRIKPKKTYGIIRRHFLIISLDHRGYGDSSPGVPPSEEGIVSDTVQIFKWLRSKTNNDLYIWGHSMGSAIATHSTRKLKERHNIVPNGLILEAVFTTLREEIPLSPIGRVFRWMPWFEATIIKPLEENGFLFKTTTNILYVDCPIMILQAEDDEIIPYALAQKVVNVAETQRKIPPQGKVIYHQFGQLGYGHNAVTDDPNIPQFVNEFIELCKDQKKSKNRKHN